MKTNLLFDILLWFIPTFILAGATIASYSFFGIKFLSLGALTWILGGLTLGSFLFTSFIILGLLFWAA